MDPYQNNLERMRTFDLRTIRQIVHAANWITAEMEGMDIALCRAEADAAAEDKSFDQKGDLIASSIRDDICAGVGEAERAARLMSIGRLIAHTMECARRLAICAEAAEEERDPAAKGRLLSDPIYADDA